MKLAVKFFKFLFLGMGLLVLLTLLMYSYRDIPINQLKEKYAPAPSQFVSVEGMEVHYRDEGIRTDSIPIVLIHGTGASLHTFEDWTKGLASTQRVISMDLPGYGLTGAFPDRDYTANNYVDFIKDFLDALQIEKCILGGNSLGGRIAWNVTVAHPERVSKLILIDASGYPAKSNSVPLAFRLAQVPVIKNLFTFVTPPFIARSSIQNVYADKSKVTDELAQRYFDLT
jgi:pimeloyl-ACP methyl ester carboxylesterase